MIIALWIVLIICVVWIALGEMPAGWDGRLPLPYFDCVDSVAVDSDACDCRRRFRVA